MGIDLCGTPRDALEVESRLQLQHPIISESPQNFVKDEAFAEQCTTAIRKLEK